MLYLWPWNLSLAIASIYGLILIDDNTIIQYNAKNSNLVHLQNNYFQGPSNHGGM